VRHADTLAGMKARSTCLAAVIAVAALSATRANAWNFVGHEVVARIAWEELTPQAREQLRLIIRQHPALQADLLKDMPADYGDKDEYAFLVAATWPDIIRDQHNPWHNQHHHDKWHYINNPEILAGTDPSHLRDATKGPTDWQPGDDATDIVQGLKKCEHDLRDPKASPADKAIALAWFLHLAGDAHQPLHANSLFSDRFPNGDRGGNSSFVRAPVLTTQPSLISPEEYLSLPGKDLVRSGAAAPATGPASTVETLSPMNMHFYWDNIFGKLAPPRVLDALFTELTTEYPPAALQPKTADLQYTDWIDESFDYAVKDVRLNGTLQTGTQDESRNNPAGLPTLPADYLARAQEVARLRMSTAGYRTAAILNDIFAKQ
jgi:hypothetical protein